MAAKKILVTGATGYIGSFILTQLLRSSNENIKSSQISVLVRGAEKAKAFSESGVNPILFNSLDESDVLEKAASEHDVVIHAASGFHSASAEALIKGLGKRKAQQGGEPAYIHTSGTSNLADRPITGLYQEIPGRVFRDDEDIYSYLAAREAEVRYSQRTTDITVVETGKKVGVKTHIIMSPAIYGFVTSNKTSIQIPGTQIRKAIEVGYAVVIEKGEGVWNYVHISDLAALYEILLGKILEDAPLRYGEQGIYFSATGQYTWMQLAQGIADAGYKLGALKTNEVRSIGLEEAAQIWTGGDTLLAELGFASNSRSKGVLTAELGWVPKKTDEDWKRNFEEEFHAIYSGRN